MTFGAVFTPVGLPEPAAAPLLRLAAVTVRLAATAGAGEPPPWPGAAGAPPLAAASSASA